MSVSVNAELVDVVTTQNTLGEGVLWNTDDNAVYWTDIQQRRLFRYDPLERRLTDWRTPERLSAFTPIEHDNALLCAFESGFGTWQPGTEDIAWIARLDTYPDVRLNDGRTDRQGRFWCGSLQEAKLIDGRQPAGQLFSLDTSKRMVVHRTDIAISNSLTTSPDGRWLYFTDTPTRRIDRYPLDVSTGQLGPADTFVTTDAGCYPDGSVTDAAGYLWNAQWGAHQVVRYAPDGTVDFTLAVPAEQPTCVAFGGTDRQLLFVTTALEGLDPQAAADTKGGSLLIYHTNVTGLAETPYRHTN
ncbi:MAG: SMP-30/gluconolactonase/LRE family protein [Pseudomonadota bacterium]